MLVQSESGMGKTVAYTIGVLSRIDTSLATCQAVVIAPTRELAIGSSRVCISKQVCICVYFNPLALAYAYFFAHLPDCNPNIMWTKGEDINIYL